MSASLVGSEMCIRDSLMRPRKLCASLPASACPRSLCAQLSGARMRSYAQTRGRSAHAARACPR
eukprot:9295395-Alexandrium_andersonii.AAC.1